MHNLRDQGFYRAAISRRVSAVECLPYLKMTKMLSLVVSEGVPTPKLAKTSLQVVAHWMRESM